MTESDKSTLATIEALIVKDKISIAKALETVYTLGELSGKLEMARLAEGRFGELSVLAEGLAKAAAS